MPGAVTFTAFGCDLKNLWSTNSASDNDGDCGFYCTCIDDDGDDGDDDGDDYSDDDDDDDDDDGDDEVMMMMTGMMK